MGQNGSAEPPQVSNEEALLAYLSERADALLVVTRTLDVTNEANARAALSEVLAFAEAFQHETVHTLRRAPALAATLRAIAARLDALAPAGDADEIAGRAIAELRTMLVALTAPPPPRERPTWT